MYSDWYVLQVTTGRELQIKEKIQKYVPHPIAMTIFQREIIHVRKGNKIKLCKPLFSSYIFIHKDMQLVYNISKKFFPNEFIYPVSADNKPCRVHQTEMELLFRTADTNGVYLLSHGYKVGDKVEIIDGPLKALQGNIIWIDEKKNKAKVEFCLFKRKMRVNLGLTVMNNNTPA